MIAVAEIAAAILKHWKPIAIVCVASGLFVYACNYGRDGALEKVNEQNQKSSAGAVKGANTVDACQRAGGVWNLVTSNCDGG
jgi:hypothetical protein